MSDMVVAKDIYKSFGTFQALKGVSLTVQKGEVLVILGPSGSGKSTFIRTINCLEEIQKGEIMVDGTSLAGGKNLHLIRRDVGMVFQSFNLFPHLTLLENITKAPIVVKKMDSKTAKEKANELLAKVGLYSHANHYPCQLSGGQQQRAAIARALAMSPKAILYDEPTSALDPGLVHEVLQVMRTLDDEGMTQIVVTHEMRFARDVADHIVHIQEGRIVEMGTPEQIFTSPSDDRTRHFLRNFN
jgi:ABC-type polar amino acid transport system ATPase subunit